MDCFNKCLKKVQYRVDSIKENGEDFIHEGGVIDKLDNGSDFIKDGVLLHVEFDSCYLGCQLSSIF